MSREERLKRLSERLVKDGYGRRLAAKNQPVALSGVAEADAMLNDLDGSPHAFVTACIMSPMIKAERAWLIPYHLKRRLGTFDFPELLGIARFQTGTIYAAMRQPPSLHRLADPMAERFASALIHIQSRYKGNAAGIWTGKPTSRALVDRFAEFHGVGPKISTMAANILIRDMHVEVSDYHAIDVSGDMHVRRVMSRMGFASPDHTVDDVVAAARRINPPYPGVIDLVVWELGREICRVTDPRCSACPYSELCAYRWQHAES